MNFRPDISFSMPGYNDRVGPDSPVWDMPLSGKKNSEVDQNEISQTGIKPFAAKSFFPNTCEAFTVGEYFLAARNFLITDNSDMLYRAVTSLSDKCGRIQAIDISLEKHGAFYHPLKITIATQSCSPLYLVLNGAVKEPGLTLVKTECRLLANMASRVIPSFIPRAFGAGEITVNGKKAAFFLGEWFAGFCEFHVTRTSNGNQVAVWQDDGTHMVIPWQTAAGIYEKIAYILTAYYDIHTGNEIYPWHHAAGDFVAAAGALQTWDVRLITIRGTAPVKNAAGDISAPGAHLLSCLLFYFLNLTLRMRLDRMDGTGPMVFLPQSILDATIKGVLTALDHRANGFLGAGTEDPPVPKDICPVFVDFVNGFSQAQLKDIMANLVDAWPSDAAERELVHENLFFHCAGICQVLKMPWPGFHGQSTKNR
jgi:hypothetical protein